VSLVIDRQLYKEGSMYRNTHCPGCVKC